MFTYNAVHDSPQYMSITPYTFSIERSMYEGLTLNPSLLVFCSFSDSIMLVIALISLLIFRIFNLGDLHIIIEYCYTIDSVT